MGRLVALRAGLLLALVTISSGCGHGATGGTYTCSDGTSNACPYGYTCVDKRCVMPGVVEVPPVDAGTVGDGPLVIPASCTPLAYDDPSVLTCNMTCAAGECVCPKPWKACTAPLNPMISNACKSITSGFFMADIPRYGDPSLPATKGSCVATPGFLDGMSGCGTASPFAANAFPGCQSWSAAITCTASSSITCPGSSLNQATIKDPKNGLMCCL